MTRKADWLSVDAALERILGRVRPLAAEETLLDDLLGRVLAEEIAAPVSHPPWDNSAMDGFAVRAADVRAATPDRPVALRIVEDIPAGSFPSRPIGPGETARIMTGAPVPEGADSVVRVEHTDAWGDADWFGSPTGNPTDEGTGSPAKIHIRSADDAGRNIRRRGEDFEEGQPLLGSGRALGPGEIGLLAAVGRIRALAHRPPTVAILSNGDELVEPDRFEEVLAGRAIVDSNSHAIAAAVQACGAMPLRLGIAGDSDSELRERIGHGLAADALVTTAGASVGAHDRVKDVLGSIGMELDFWRVKIRPGSPFSFGMLRDRTLPVFGLPGNPVSALVTFHVLVRPALLRMLGRERVQPPTVPVVAGEDMRTKEGLTHYLRVQLQRGEDGGWQARLTGPQGSGIMSSMAKADALLVVPASSGGLAAGERAAAIPLRPPEDWT